MTVRFYLTDDDMFLDTRYISALAQTAIDKGEELVTTLVSRLPLKDKLLTLSDKQFLVLAGTTTELKEFRTALKSAKVEAIGIKQGRDPLVTWCTRVDVNHPDKTFEKNTTVTLVLIGLESLFLAAGVSKVPIAPWKAFPHNVGPSREGGFLHLDRSFEAALDVAQKHRKAN
jgi:hypothetical protein